MLLDWPTQDDQIGAVYAKYAPIYDALFQDSLKDAAFYLDAAARRLSPGDTILELGVGTGRLTDQLLAAGYRVVGVDSSPDMLDRARARLAPYGDRVRLVHGDMRELRLEERFRLIVAPFGTVAHLLTDGDRARTYDSVFRHLVPDGVFIFDDLPGWLAGPALGTSLDLRTVSRDPATGQRIRLQTNLFDASAAPVSVRYDFIDWLDADDRVDRRVVVRVVFRNIALDDELALLAQAGFSPIDLYGDFAGAPLDREHPAQNARLVVHCYRPSA